LRIFIKFYTKAYRIDGASAEAAMTATGWIEKRLESRHQAARARLIHQQRRVNARKRAWSRDIARVMLVGSMLMLGVLAVEIGRKAVTVLHNASVTSSVSIG
jgi:hypothetical protein